MSKLDRINENIKRVLSKVISEDMKDPDIPVITSITEVRMTDDFKYAKVYVSTLGNENEKEKTIAALKRAEGYLRSRLADGLELRKVPELNFKLDEVTDYGNKINEILKDIQKDKED